MKTRFYFLILMFLVATLILAACGGEPASAQGYGTAEFLKSKNACASNYKVC